jgi:hypothetical protein
VQLPAALEHHARSPALNHECTIDIPLTPAAEPPLRPLPCMWLAAPIVANLRALNPASRAQLAVVRERLAGALLARGDLAGARGKLGEALPVLEQALSPDAVELIEARTLAAQLQQRGTWMPDRMTQ